MAAPVIFSGSRSKLLTSAGILTSAGRTIDFDGDINYISNSGFEVNATGYAAYSNTAGTAPVTGAGGSPTVTIARSTTTPLFDTASGLFTKDAANRQGQGFSYDFSIDSAVSTSATPCTISGFYKIASGTYATGDMTVWIYDVTNGVVIQPSASSILNVVGAAAIQCEFQPAVNSTSYRLIFHVSTTSASAYTVQFDNLAVRPNTYNPGSCVTDWVSTRSFTPTNFGVVTNNTWYTRRVGDQLEVMGSFTSGTPTASSGYLALPAGMAIDTTKASNTGGGALGFGNLITNGGSAGIWNTSGNATTVFCDGSTTTQVFLASASASSTFTKTLANAIAASGSILSFKFTVPIAGWGTTQVLSSDTDTRVVAAIITGDPASATVGNPVIVPTVVYDSHGAYNATTGRYTVSVPGIYKMYGALSSASSATTLTLYKNAVSTILAGSLDSNGEGTYAGSMSCIAGDIIDVRPGGTVDATSFTLNIERTSGPAQIAASESVNARYYASATSLSGSLATIVWTTKDYDSHLAMSSGVYTCPISGKYQVNAQLGVSGTFALNTQTNLVIQKNGTTVSEVLDYAAGAETADHMGISDIISCIAGDTIRVQLSSGATGPAIISSNTKNYISIARVGN